MTKIIAFANHKGGVGKTTSVSSIGAALARKGKKVLVVDMDAQQNLTFCFMKEDVIEPNIYDALIGKTELPIHHIKENLDIVPSGLGLARAEIDLSTRLAREQILKNLLEPIKDNYDFILLDCPPSLGIVTTNALTAATDLYIPLTAEALPLKGLTMLDDVVEEIRRSINKELKLSGVFVTRYNKRKLNELVEDAIKAKYGSIVFNTRIRENISLAEAPLTGKDIYEYSNESNGAKDYNSLADEILKRNE